MASTAPSFVEPHGANSMFASNRPAQTSIQEAMERDLVELTEEKNALTAHITKMAREIQALKRELSRQREDSPKMQDAQEVFDYWVDKLGKTKRTTFGPKRQKCVIARLGEKALSDSEDRKDDLLEAVRGLAAKRYVGPKGRQPEPGPGAKLHDELEIAMRDETAVERFMGYAKEGAPTPIRPVPSEIESMMARCDCGHVRGVHSYPLEPLWVPENMVGWEPCRECECCDFDDIGVRHGRQAA